MNLAQRPASAYRPANRLQIITNKVHSSNVAPMKVRNELLASLTPQTQAQLRPGLQLVTVRADLTLYHPDSPLDFIYFPETCVATRLALLEDGATVEVGLLGCDSVIGATAVMGATRACHWTLVELAGQAYRVRTGFFLEMVRRHPDLHKVVFRYYHKLFQEVSQRAACRARHSLLAQLCTWLLSVQDRAATTQLALTQETIARRLGARRAGVTVTANELRQQGALAYSRGHIEILDRSRLENLACECYAAQRASVV